MYSPDELNEFAASARVEHKPTFRLDIVCYAGESESNYAMNLSSYQEAVCMADSCLHDGCYSVRISREG